MRQDPIASIVRTNRGRMPELLRRKFTAMAGDSFAFLRASARLSHESIDFSGLPRAPRAWVCGDLHLQNFGSFRGENRLTYFDLNDFDEAALLPASVDILRLLASLLCASPGLGIERSQASALALHAARSYGIALAHAKALWLEPETAEGPIRELLKRTRGRRRRDLLAMRTRRIDGARRLAVDVQRYLPVGRDDPVREEVAIALGTLATRYEEPSYFHPRDVAFRVAGMGSLGVPRYVALVRGKGDPDRNALIDFKLAVPSAAVLALPQYAQPAWEDEADRIVSVQGYCQAASPAFLGVVRMLGRAFVARELQPLEDRISMEPLASHRRKLDTTLESMARLSAWSQLRAASRNGAAGTDDLAAWGEQVLEQAVKFVHAAEAMDAANQASHARFQRAWKQRDPRLLALVRDPARG
jgi:uncharacterized protein (DUF2252 family)